MKASHQNKKWVLTASLLAVLSANYGLQTNSLHRAAGEANFSSLNDTTTTTATTEAATTACKDCVLTPMAELNALKAQIAALQAAAVKTQTPVANQFEDECPQEADETAAQLARRQRCIRNEGKKADKLAREEKLKLKQEELVGAFEDKVSDAKDKCADESDQLVCLTEEFNSLVSKYSGTKKVPYKAVAAAFKTLITPEINKALFSDDPEKVEAAKEAISSLLTNVPGDYSALKTGVMNLVKTKATAAAEVVKAGYKTVTEMLNAKNPAAAQTFQQVQEEHRKVAALSSIYAGTIQETAIENNDSLMLDYYRSSFLPDMNKILSGITAPPAATSTATTPAVATQGTTAQNSRTLRAGETTMQLPVNNGRIESTIGGAVWSAPSTNVNFGAGATSNQSRGGRGPRTN